MASVKSQIATDAAEFGRIVKQGGWRLGLLVARNVQVVEGKGTRTDLQLVGSSKVSPGQFAKLSGVSDETVRLYWHAWNFAAKAGKVISSEELSPGDEDGSVEFEELDEDDRVAWDEFYKMARNRNKVDKPPEKPSPTPKPKSKPKETPQLSDDDAFEMDKGRARDRLLDVKESIDSKVSDLKYLGGMYDSGVFDTEAVRDVIVAVRNSAAALIEAANELTVKLTESVSQ